MIKIERYTTWHQIELLPRITILYGKDCLDNGIGFEWLWFGCYIYKTRVVKERSNEMHDVPCHCDQCEKELEDALNDENFMRGYEEALRKGGDDADA